MRRAATHWAKIIIAILLGNVAYFALEPHLPYAARHHAYRPDLGTLVDLWLCLAIYGMIEFASFIRRRSKR